ncbi:WD repeat-containing protein 18-like [Arctopsyche grandis]|uniref:WD repeat-containing protein 18-like n=1 Tax=Arctopsyche grandis TaxID=121162 RepID=UPI00406D9F2B
MELLEVAITSETTGQLWNSSVWDVHLGTSLMSYKGGGVAAPRTLCLINEDYIASIERTKPILHVWPLNSHEQVQGFRFVLPGRPTSLAFSPSGNYCVAGIEEKIYIWQMSSGSLLNILTRHYQTVTNLKFTDDGSHFISAGEDGIVLVWTLNNVITNPGIQMISQSNSDPLYIFSDHSLPVKDIFIGKGGIRCRLITISIDRTCKIYDLSSGELLLNVVFDKSLSAVTMDIMEMNIFVGTVDGEILQYSIANPPRVREYHISDKDKSLIFSGHTKAVTCLSASLDGKTLISGSNDTNLIVWHINSRQKTYSIAHRGPITNAFLTVVPKNMFTTVFNPSIVLHSFQRSIDFSSDIEVLTKESNNFWDDCANEFSDAGVNQLSSNSDFNSEKLKAEINKLKDINKSLYQFAINNILEGAKSKDIVKLN